MSKPKKLRYKSKIESHVEKPKQEQELESQEPKIPLPAWFERKVKQGKLRSWQESAIEVFMKKQGLTILETEDKYEEMFRKF